MQKEQGKASEEGGDAIRRVGAPEDEMAALERQLAPAVIPALQGGTRALGFVSAGIEIQGSAGEVKNPDEIELGEEDEEEVEESENIEVTQKKVPDAVYGDLAEAAKKLLQNDEGGKQRSRESDEPMGALERFKRQRQQ